jgi:hypothetical protein
MTREPRVIIAHGVHVTSSSFSVPPGLTFIYMIEPGELQQLGDEVIRMLKSGSAMRNFLTSDGAEFPQGVYKATYRSGDAMPDIHLKFLDEFHKITGIYKLPLHPLFPDDARWARLDPRLRSRIRASIESTSLIPAGWEGELHDSILAKKLPPAVYFLRTCREYGTNVNSRFVFMLNDKARSENPAFALDNVYVNRTPEQTPRQSWMEQQDCEGKLRSSMRAGLRKRDHMLKGYLECMRTRAKEAGIRL